MTPFFEEKANGNLAIPLIMILEMPCYVLNGL